jgi:hypothetical protein
MSLRGSLAVREIRGNLIPSLINYTPIRLLRRRIETRLLAMTAWFGLLKMVSPCALDPRVREDDGQGWDDFQLSIDSRRL